MRRLNPCMDYKSILRKQATINIGTIGHVAHGKSTLVRAISTVKTVKYKSELERNITIKLGYANAKIYECQKCPRPGRYKSLGSDGPEYLTCSKCGSRMELIKHVSFVDCPGHDVLMATMLTGTCIMDAAILLIAANEPCPQPQTQEHLFAIEIMGLTNLLIVQNKCDLVLKEICVAHKEQIDEFVSGMQASGAPVVPASCQLGINVDAVLDFIVNGIPEPDRIKGVSYIQTNDKIPLNTLKKYFSPKKETGVSEEDSGKKTISHLKEPICAEEDLKSSNNGFTANKKESGSKEDRNGLSNNNDNLEHVLESEELSKKPDSLSSDIKSLTISKENDHLNFKSSKTKKSQRSKSDKKIEVLEGIPTDNPIIANRENPRMVVIRSFDVNKPGCLIEDLQGGIIGGTLLKGILTIGDTVEIRPGNVTKGSDGTFQARPYITKITSLQAEANNLAFAVPGGLIGVGTSIDPFYSRSDRLVGQVLGLVGKLPNIYQKVEITHTLFKKIATALAVKDSKVSVVKKGEQLLLNIGSTSTGCTVTEIDSEKLHLDLIKPACTETGERVALSRKIGNHWRLIGYGQITGGSKIDPIYDST